MSDPRYTDPRTTNPRLNDPINPRLNDPVLRPKETGGSMWGWVAGLAVLALIAFVVVAGWNGSNTTASNNSSAPITTGANAPMRNVTPPASTTGSGATAPEPATPAPAQSPNSGR